MEGGEGKAGWGQRRLEQEARRKERREEKEAGHGVSLSLSGDVSGVEVAADVVLDADAVHWAAALEELNARLGAAAGQAAAAQPEGRRREEALRELAEDRAGLMREWALLRQEMAQVGLYRSIKKSGQAAWATGIARTISLYFELCVAIPPGPDAGAGAAQVSGVEPLGVDFSL